MTVHRRTDHGCSRARLASDARPTCWAALADEGVTGDAALMHGAEADTLSTSLEAARTCGATLAVRHRTLAVEALIP